MSNNTTVYIGMDVHHGSFTLCSLAEGEEAPKNVQTIPADYLLVVKYINQTTVATNADRVLGSTARVTEAIDNTVPVGAVYVDGKTWSARSENGEEIAEGTMVRVTRMEGVRLFVEEIKED